MTPEEFDIEYLNSVIDSVVSGSAATVQPIPVAPTQPNSTEQAAFRLPLGDTRVLSLLWQQMQPVLGEARTWQIIKPVIETIAKEAQATTLSDVHTAVKNCRRCPNVIAGPHLPVGNWKDPDLVIIWSIPPMKNQLPERTLLEMLIEAGFQKERIAYTSIIRCDTKAKDTPTKLEIENCLDYLSHELGIVTPRLSLLIGAPAFNAIFPQHSYTDSCGNIFWLGPLTFMPIYSISYAKNQNKLDKLVSDLTSAWRFCYDK